MTSNGLMQAAIRTAEQSRDNSICLLDLLLNHIWEGEGKGFHS